MLDFCHQQTCKAPSNRNAAVERLYASLMLMLHNTVKSPAYKGTSGYLGELAVEEGKVSLFPPSPPCPTIRCCITVESRAYKEASAYLGEVALEEANVSSASVSANQKVLDIVTSDAYKRRRDYPVDSLPKKAMSILPQ